ncbi:MAG: site-specific integrase [Bacteroidia bacterium]|nr:site-specific integrase [Bacteroidia bacterium]MCF8447053.1 site-specific integrase [Bacteroidia bacterium]
MGKENSRTTYLKYDLAKRHMVAFLKRNYKAGDVSVKSVNHFMITQFSLFMKTELKLSHNTSTKFLHNLKKITTIALHHGWILRDPFKGFNLKLNEVSRPYLTNNELQRLMLYNSPFDRINRVRDFFVFSCFTGLAYADVKKLKGNEIEQNDGIYWIGETKVLSISKAQLHEVDVIIQVDKGVASSTGRFSAGGRLEM